MINIECDIRREGDLIVIRMDADVAEFYAEALDKITGDDGAAEDARELRRLADDIRDEEEDDR